MDQGWVIIVLIVAGMATPVLAERSRSEDLNWGWEIELTPEWFFPGLHFFDVNALVELHPQLRTEISEAVLDRYFERDPLGALAELSPTLRHYLTEGLDLSPISLETENLSLPGNTLIQKRGGIENSSGAASVKSVAEKTILGRDGKTLSPRGVLLSSDGQPVGTEINNSGGESLSRKSQIILPAGAQMASSTYEQRQHVWKIIRSRWRQLGEEYPEARRRAVNFKYLPALETSQLLWPHRKDLKLDPEQIRRNPVLGELLTHLVFHSDRGALEFKPPREVALSKAQMLEQIGLFQKAFHIPDSIWTDLSPGISLHLTVSLGGKRDISRIAQLHSLVLVKELKEMGVEAETFVAHGAFAPILDNRRSPGRLRPDGSYEVRIKRAPSKTTDELESALTQPEPEALRGMLKRLGPKVFLADPLFHLQTLTRLAEAEMKVNPKRWVELLQNPSPEIRQAVLKRLSDLPKWDPKVIPAIEDALVDESGVVRKAALAVLAKARGSNANIAQAKLLSHLDHPSAEVRETALEALIELGTSKSEILHAAERKLQDSSPQVRIVAFKYLRETQPPDVLGRIATRMLRDSSAQMRALALAAIIDSRYSEVGLGSELVKLLADPALEVRKLAGMAAGNNGRGEPDLLPALVKLLRSEVSEDQKIGLSGLLKINPQDPAIALEVIRCLESPFSSVIELAEANLLEMKASDPASIQALLHLLSSHGNGTVETALTLLGELAPSDPEAVRAVTRLVGSDQLWLKLLAIETLSKMTPDAEAIQALDEARNDISKRVAKAAVKAHEALSNQFSLLEPQTHSSRCGWRKVGG